MRERRKGNTAKMIVTYTGNYFDYANITADSINLDDMLHSLSSLNRFVGHAARPYSVAEHLVKCYTIARALGYSKRECLLVLIHDFTEAYMGDCPSPLKALLPDFSKLEAQTEEAILDYLELDPITEEEHKKIKLVDYTALVIEMRDLTLHDHMNFVESHEHCVAMDIVNDRSFAISKEDNFGHEVWRVYLQELFELADWEELEEALANAITGVVQEIAKKIEGGRFCD